MEAIPKLFDTFQSKHFNVSNKATISFRPKGTKFFYLSNKRTKGQVCTIDLDVNTKVYTQNPFCEVEDINDLNMHGKIHLNSNTNEDLFVVHLHGPRNVLSYSCLLHYVELSSIRRYFPELDTDYRIAKNLEYTFDYEQESDGLILAEDVHSRLTDNDIVLLTNHGIVAKGKSPESIVDMIDEIEYYCGIAIHDSVRIYQN
jgi:ribulose-5-phosphate 4-epimerase/fuculose-1-phosphate aldolase